MAATLRHEKGNLQVKGVWNGEEYERLYTATERPAPPLDRLVCELGLPPGTPIDKVCEVLAAKSWDGKQWVEDPPPALAS
jgi:hypothetical protein